MPVYNGGEYLKETIDSVLRQTFTDFELLIVNDGSTDKSKSIIDAYSKKDDRIRAFHRKNSGLVETLNFAISEANAAYLARIDADDPSFESRLQEQYSLFDKDKSLVLVGGGFEIIDENGYFIETIHPPIIDKDIRRTLMLRNPFGHSGVMYKKSAVIKAGLYSNQFGPTEDYDLWIRLSKIGSLANLPKPIYRYRINRKGVSQTNSQRQAEETKQHIQGLWSQETPSIIGRAELLISSQNYIKKSKTLPYGVGLKTQYLSDNAQIGIKLIRYGHYLKGMHQLLNVASTGRTGARVVVKRLKMLDTGSIKQVRD